MSLVLVCLREDMNGANVLWLYSFETMAYFRARGLGGQVLEFRNAPRDGITTYDVLKHGAFFDSPVFTNPAPQTL